MIIKNDTKNCFSNFNCLTVLLRMHWTNLVSAFIGRGRNEIIFLTLPSVFAWAHTKHALGGQVTRGGQSVRARSRPADVDRLNPPACSAADLLARRKLFSICFRPMRAEVVFARCTPLRTIGGLILKTTLRRLFLFDCRRIRTQILYCILLHFEEGKLINFTIP